jgi:hypothetical protein
MEALLEKKKQIEGLLIVIESQIKIQEMIIGNEIKESNEKLKKNKKSFNEFLKESNEIKKCYICEKIYIEEKKEYEIPGFTLVKIDAIGYISGTYRIPDMYPICVKYVYDI